MPLQLHPVPFRFQVKFFYLCQLAYWLHALPELYFQKVRKVRAGSGPEALRPLVLGQVGSGRGGDGAGRGDSFCFLPLPGGHPPPAAVHRALPGTHRRRVPPQVSPCHPAPGSGLCRIGIFLPQKLQPGLEVKGRKGGWAEVELLAAGW